MNSPARFLATFGLLWLGSLPLALAETAPSAQKDSPLTLSDCYKLALKQSETIAIQQEKMVEAEVHFSRAFSGILPQASFSSTDKRQDGNGGSQFTLRKVPDRKFVFSQPLFSGFKEFAAMAGTQAERRQRAYEKTRAEHLLLVDVADAFYLLQEKREDLATLEMIRAALAERVDELKERVRIGRSRTGEVISAEAQRLRVEADLESARTDETVVRQLLEFLTGRDRIEAIQDPVPPLPPMESEAAYLPKAASRPDVRATEEAAVVAQKQISIAKAGYLPTVGLNGNYYVERAGVSKDISWDASLVVSVPIFTGGETKAAVKEAVSQARQAELLSQETRRRAVLDIRDAYEILKMDLSRSAALSKALDAADENYRLQVQDYRRSLVNNLDVLQALQSFQDSRRDFIRAHYEARRQYWRLHVAIGETL